MDVITDTGGTGAIDGTVGRDDAGAGTGGGYATEAGKEGATYETGDEGLLIPSLLRRGALVR